MVVQDRTTGVGRTGRGWGLVCAASCGVSGARSGACVCSRRTLVDPMGSCACDCCRLVVARPSVCRVSAWVFVGVCSRLRLAIRLEDASPQARTTRTKPGFCSNCEGRIDSRFVAGLSGCGLRSSLSRLGMWCSLDSVRLF